MSTFCCISLTKYNLTQNFEEYNSMANALVRYALENGIAVFFNTCDYGDDLIKSKNMRCFITLSDSFIYRQADELLDNTQFVPVIKTGSLQAYKDAFTAKYAAIKGVLDIIFNYSVNMVEFYISDMSSTNFITQDCTLNDFTEKLFNCVNDNVAACGGSWMMSGTPEEIEAKTRQVVELVKNA